MVEEVVLVELVGKPSVDEDCDDTDKA